MRSEVVDAEVEPLVRYASHFHLRGACPGRLQAPLKQNTIDYRRVLEARASDVKARLGLGVLLARTDRLDPAVVELSRVLELAPAEDEARFERAVAYARLGRTDEARADFERLDDPATRPDIRQAARRALK